MSCRSQIVLSAFVAVASAIVAPAYGGYGYPGYGALHGPIAAAPIAHAVAPAYGGYPYGYNAGYGYHGAYAAPIVKTAAIAHHPISTSYANTYKVASAYPHYAHAPVAAAYAHPISAGYAHAPIAGKNSSPAKLFALTFDLY